ncbi:putative aldouronate transport system permease protein [Paenibacillus sp. yr247]|uniref:carbohydrate ABC transporter permease n=1 Tax=Paenibacillus sp. yr247 TaxID=1761880 RepID=UPI000890D437|nr:carbohydrate ABC transporter permease [Paenibacillus sp. yr247]SDO34771.1 putative aldouronate transport system permease protein [Paenibacillus sp. yr247]
MKSTRGEKIFNMVNYLVLMLLALSCLLPLIHVFAMSLSGARAIASGEVGMWPIDITLDTYREVFKGTKIVQSFFNSVVITSVGIVLSMLTTILAAYPLSKNSFYARRFFTLAMVFTMLFNGGIIPTFLVVKGLGLIDSYGALWLPALVSTYNMLIMRTYFEGIPAELEEAARIDGCSEWRLLAQIVLPLSMPVLATLTLFYGVSYWNYFMSVLLYINSTDKYNMTVLVQQMVQNQQLLNELRSPEDTVQLVAEGVKAAAIVLMMIPMLVVYPFVQKFFVKGVMLGAVKG